MATDNDQLPSEFDVIVIGTGLTESIISAAVSRIGHTVLHIDPRDYYGGKWGTLSWDTWITGNFAKIPARLDINTTKTIINLNNQENNIEWNNDVFSLEQVWYLEHYGEENENVQEKILGQSRRFNIDIFPKVLMAREPLTKLLIQSNVSRYLEFKCITKLFSTLLPPNEHTIEAIPLSRSDIFTTKTISLIEKRSLMKFIESIMKMKNDDSSIIDESENGGGESDSSKLKTFEELSKQCNLSKKVQHLLKSAVRTMDDCYFDMNSNSDSNDTSSSGFNKEFSTNCKQFLESIGQYGNKTPFLWTLYGISEVCQAFCRMSAIYGGIFILKRSVESIQASEKDTIHKVQVISEGKEIRSKYLVLGPELKRRELWDDDRSISPKLRQGLIIARAVLITVGPRLRTTCSTTCTAGVADDDDPTNLSIHRIDDMDILELDETSLAVPKTYRLLQVTCPYLSSDSISPRTMIESRLSSFVDFHYSPQYVSSPAQNANLVAEGDDILPEPADTENVVHQIVPPTKPVVIYGSYFLINFSDDVQTSENVNTNVFSCSVSSTEISEHVKKASLIFTKMFPNEEFLPKAPDPAEAHDENEIYPGEMVDDVNDVIGNPNNDEADSPNIMHNGNLHAPEDPIEEDLVMENEDG